MHDLAFPCQQLIENPEPRQGPQMQGDNGVCDHSRDFCFFYLGLTAIITAGTSHLFM
jgi:hypothetical protein